jgi:hypothetical protein
MSASAPAITEVLHKQTGPQSPKGKERSSNNATLHGGTSKKLIVPGENSADFEALLNGLLDDHRPDTLESRLLTEQVAIAQWFLWRRLRAYNAIETAVYESEPNEANWTDQHLKRIALADRYKTQAERALKRALDNMGRWQKTRQRKADSDRRRSQWEAEQAVRERRVALQEQKLELARTREERQAFRFAKCADAPPAHPEPSSHEAPSVVPGLQI